MDTARDILEQNLYCNLATVCADGTPWNSPLFFGFDDDTVYWRSAKDSQHSKNVVANGHAFVTIYDSKQDWGKGFGLYMRGTAHELTDQSEVAAALACMDSRTGKQSDIKQFIGNGPRRVYKFIPNESWTNNTQKKAQHLLIREKR